MENCNKSVSILGSGNVGKRIGEQFEKYFDVIFYDINKDVIQELNDLGHTGTTDIDYALNNTNISFVAVPTPLNSYDHMYDVSYLKNISKKIGNALKEKNDYHIFIIKSTVTPGTTERIIIPITENYSEKREGQDFGVIYNPEFLTVISDTWTKDTKFCINVDNEERIVIGEGENKKTGDVIEKLYMSINPNIPVLRTSYKTAEMTKLVANNRLALAISFSNEIFLICEELKKKGIDIDDKFVIDAISRDRRIGKYGSVYGKAWGGPCFLKDTVALNSYLKHETGRYYRLIHGSIETNNVMKEEFGIRE